MVQYYRGLWSKRSETLAPLTELTKGGPTKNVAVKCTPACNEAFQKMKSLITKETILAYPDFIKIHDPHRHIGRATGHSSHARS